LQDMKRGQKNMRVARMKRWATLRERGVMAIYNREEVEPAGDLYLAQGLSGDDPLPQGCFEPGKLAGSLDEEELKRMGTEKVDYACTSAQGMQAQVAAWALLMQCSKLDCWSDAHLAWQSLLAPQDGIVVNTVCGEGFVVLRTTVWGMLVWPAAKIETVRHTLWSPATDGPAVAMWEAVLNAEHFCFVPTQVVPPSVAKELFVHPEDVKVGVFLMECGERLGLYKAAAKEGFKALNENYLLKALQLFGKWHELPPGQRPKTTLAKCETLLRAVNPDISDQEVAECLRARVGLQAKKLGVAPLLAGENLELMAGVLDADDVEAAKETREKATSDTVGKAMAVGYIRQRTLMPEYACVELLAAAGAKPQQAKPAAAAAAEPAKKGLWSWEEKYLKARLPGVVGATIMQVPQRNCWTARYPGAVPASRTRTYSKGLSCDLAAKHCFQWLWVQHEGATGEKCPYELQDELEKAPGA